MDTSRKIVGIVGTLLLIILLAAGLALAIPPVINYQGKLVDSVGEPVNDSVDITFTIYNAPTGGDVLWTETQNVSIVNGIFNVYLGSIEEITASTFDTDILYLGIQVAGNAEMTPRQLYSAAPFAFRAHSADMVAEGAVTSAMITNGAILGEDIATDTITSNEIAAEAVTSSEIEDGTITDADIDANASISASKINRTDLNADLLDGKDFQDFAASAHQHQGSDIIGTVNENNIDAAIARDNEVIGIVTANDGPGSAVDADKLDGKESSEFFDRASFDLNADGVMDSANDADTIAGYGIAALDARYGLAPKQVPHSNTINKLDTTGSTGRFTSITIGADGLPVISYLGSGGSLRVAKCNDATCTAALTTLNTVDSCGANCGYYTSIAIAPDGNPVISYHDDTLGDLRVAKCGDLACSPAFVTISTLDTGGGTNDVGEYSSISIGTDGYPVVSYYDATSKDLKVAKCANATCSSRLLYILDSLNDVGEYTSIAIGIDGYPVISYYDSTNLDLKVAHCGDASCTPALVTTYSLDGMGGNDVGKFTSIMIDNFGRPMISYYDETNNYLKIERCYSTDCSGASATIVDSSGAVGDYTSIAIGADGYPVISYHATTNYALRTAKCFDPSCESTMGPTVINVGDSEGSTGYYTSIAVPPDGNPIISYYVSGNDDLLVLKCANPLCLDNWTRR